MSKRWRVMVYVQHLLGSGHLRRAAALARECAAAGLDTLLVSGGRPIADLDLGGAAFAQLPPAAARDENFSGLIDERGANVNDAWRAARRERLLSAFAEFCPDALVTEMYPFGRRQMAFELLPLLDAAWATRPRPLIVSSVRDILQAKPGKTLDAMAALARDRFDRVLVHGDRDFVSLDATFPVDPALAAKLAYTGYIAEPVEARGTTGDPGWDEIIVSSGGGAVGAALLATALAARPMTKTARAAVGRRLAGGELPADDFARLHAAAPAGVIVERSRTDFRRLLANARLSVSQAGYNTVMEILAARARAVLVPFAGSGQTEQPLRADLLRMRGRAEVVAENSLTPPALAAAIDRALATPVADIALKRDGAREGARLLAAWLAGKAPAV
jgi:predicted glycosyltransferase